MEQYGMRFNEMNKKQKINHIWEYYKYHILATIIAVIVCGSIAKNIFFPEPPNEVDILFAGHMYIDKNESEIKKYMKEEYSTGIEFNNINWEADPEVASVMYQKIPLLIRIDELDIMAMPKDPYTQFVITYGEDMFIPLEEVPELSDLLEKYQDSLYVCDKIIDEDDNIIDVEPHVYGIKTDTFSSNISCIAASEEMVIGLNPNAKDLDKAISMLKYILE